MAGPEPVHVYRDWGSAVKKTTAIVALLAAASLQAGCGDKKKKSSSVSEAPAAPTPQPASSDPADTIPAVTFTAPGDDSQKIVKGASYDVVVAFANASATATWSLYYTPTKDTIAGGLPILEDLPVATTKVSWDTSFVDPGVYYLYGIFINEGVTYAVIAPGSFKFEGSLDLNKAPVTSVSSPDGDRVYAPGDTVAITFVASDADEDPLDVKIEYTTNGSQWETIADNIDKDTNQYEWTIPTDAVQSARYRIRVVASDGKLTGEALNGKVFGVTQTPVIWTAQVQNLVTAQCGGAACHSADLPTGLNLSNYAAANGAKQSILDRTRTTASSPMPPANDAQMRKLSADDRDLIQLWLWNNAAQN